MKKIIITLAIFIILGGASERLLAVGNQKKVTVTPQITIVPTTTEVNIAKEEVKKDKFIFVNSLRLVVEGAISRGVSEGTIVLLLLLPLVATLVSVLHYVFGFSGYGIFMPTMIAITFLATGISGGLILFAMILGISIVSNMLLKKLKLHFWPARSINLMFISLGTFGLMVLSSYWKFIDISKITIFPILFMILLAEEFGRTQLSKSKGEAVKLTIGTLLLSISGALLMSVKEMQNLALRFPELIVLLVLVINILVGNYAGIRLTEVKRFKKAIRIKK